MKKTDIAMIILVASVSMLISYLVVDALPMFKEANKSVVVKTTHEITDEVVEPSSEIFNDKAINPTVEVIIGDKGQE